jgi:hypothetical protein
MAKKSNSAIVSEQKKLIGIAILVVIAMGVIAGIVMGRTMNPLFIVLLVLLLHYFYYVPKFSSKYYKFMGAKSNASIWIPVFNEINIFPRKWFVASLVGYALCILSFIFCRYSGVILPIDFIDTLRRVIFFVWFLFFMITAVQLFIILGMGWTSVRKILYSPLVGQGNSRVATKASEAFMVFLLFIPIARMYTIMYMLEDLVELVDIKELDIKKVIEVSKNDLTVVTAHKRNSILEQEDK